MNLSIPDFEYNDAKHSYKYRGEKLSGVTTFTGTISKPRIIQWAADVASSYWKSAVNEAARNGSSYDEDKIYEEARYAHRNKKESSANTGKETHKWYENYAKTGVVGPLPNALSKEQADSIVRWRKNWKVETIASEVPMCSPTYLYGMTFDEIAVVGGKLTLVDIKTTSGTSFEQHLQTAAYQQGIQEISKEKIEQRILLGIPQNSKVFEAVIIQTSFEDDFGAFVDQMRQYRMVKYYEKLGYGFRRWK